LGFYRALTTALLSGDRCQNVSDVLLLVPKPKA
jgi:hypothetical protein